VTGERHEGGAAGTPAAPPSDELAQARDVFTHALVAGDALAASTAYAADAKLLAPAAGLVEGRREIEAFWRAGIEAGVAELVLEPKVVEQGDAIAYEIGDYSLRVGNSDDTIVDQGTYALVHQRQHDGRWLRTLELLDPKAREERRKCNETATPLPDPPLKPATGRGAVHEDLEQS